MSKALVPGVFDVFHIERLNYLLAAGRQGDEQIVAETDASRQSFGVELDDSAQAAEDGYRYLRWQHARALDELDAQLFRERASALWKKRLLFEFCFVLQPGAESLLADSIDSISRQYYDGWRLSIFARTPSPEDEFTREDGPVRWLRIPGRAAPEEFINEHLLQTPAHWVGFFECGTRFAPQLLLSLSDHLAIHPEWRAIYADEDTVEENGERRSPRFKPDFNLELLRSADYIGSLFVERNTLLAAGGYSKIPDAADFDNALRIHDAVGDSAIGHIPDILLHTPAAVGARAAEGGAAEALREHLVRRGIVGEVFQGLVEGATRRVVYRHSGTPRVSIIIPTKNRLDLLRPCVESLLGLTSYPDWELLLVDNGSDDAAVLAWYDALLARHAGRVRLLRFDAPFNYSAMNNLAAREARGEYLLLLNNDTECIHDDWLEAMMAHAQRPDVGVVGARLLFPASLRVQHAGVVLGLTGTAGHVFINALAHDEPGYLNRALTDQEYSAVTGACLLIRKSLFDEIGGLDEEALRISFNDVDLCLKARRRGYRVVWTPFATLLHHGSATQLAGSVDPARAAVFQNEVNAFYQRWAETLADDPAWNRNLSLAETTPAIEDELAVPWQREFHDRPRVAVMPSISASVAEYRFLAPLRALHAAGKLHHVAICRPRPGFERAPMPVELARMAPDTLLMHLPVDNTRCLALLRYQRANPEILRIYSMDDLIHQLPPDNPFHRALPAEVMAERLQIGLAASHRLIVSTEPLAEACRHRIDDIRLIPNALDWAVWGELQSRRRRAPRLRVGWAGAQQHAGDLRFVREIVEATRREVDWVFLGMMPEGLDSRAVEFHDYVHDHAAYPAKLASLDLDLAIAPLEQHPFNEAKSNLRLLEYGALGWPVICTDILPYRTDDPPVTRLPNDTARWIEAIRERAACPDALAREGDALRAWVEENYRLERYLDLWLKALLP
ncbi:MAG: glycosyltransferase [Candidatus Accumulibacter sp.]|jgi:GT2 family glycosyltransferase|nr:glycosyltransferase [Accumulibacter sp.]